MFGLHPIDLIVVLVVALLIFGPKKLPEMGSAIGKSIKEFRKGMNELSNPSDSSKNNALRSPKEVAEENRITLHSPVESVPNLESASVSSTESTVEKPVD